MKNKNLFLTAALIILIIMNFITYKKLNLLQTSIPNEIDRRINDEIRRLRNSMYSEIDNLKDNQKWITNSNYTITNILENKLIETTLAWNLKYIEPESDLFICYGE